MKVDTSKLKKGSSELTAECKQLIDQINKCRSRSEISQFLGTINIWIYGKCELYHWIPILDRFDKILEEAAHHLDSNEYMLACDSKFPAEDIHLLLLVLNFTTLLIEHSFSRHLYNSVEHLTQLLSSQNMDIVLAVLNLLFMFAKRSNFIPRLSFEKKEMLLTKLLNIAERWGDPNYGLALIDCCIREPKLEFIYQLSLEYIDENGQVGLLEIPDVVDTCKGLPLPEVVKAICGHMKNPSEAIRMRIAHRIRLVSGFMNYRLRLQFVQARLQAVSILIYSNVLQDDIERVLYPGFGEELCELIDKDDMHLVEIRAAVLRTLTSMLHFDRNPNVPRPGSRLSKIIQYTGAERQGGILPLLVADCILSLTHEGICEKYPLVLATSLFSLLYHLASYEEGGNALIKSGMMKSLLQVISWPVIDLEHITFVTRAVRVIDLITNIDIVKFHQNNGLNVFIDRIEKEVNCCREVLSDSDKQNEPSDNADSITDDIHMQQKSNDTDVKPNVSKSRELEETHSASTNESSSHCSEKTLFWNPENSYYTRTSSSNTENKSTQLQGVKKQACVTQRAALLKSMLNFLKKSIQDHANFNGMRNIMESSLPNSLRHIISNAEYYGPSLFLLATDVVTVYIFNEPSLLSSLQDSGLTSVMLHSLLQKHVPATREVLGSLPNVFSAMCLNERGLVEFMSYEPFDKLFKVLLSSDYLVAMRRRRSSDPLGDTATNLGNAMDDLMKHHPYLRTDATEAIVRLLNELVRLGSDSKFICWRAQKENSNSFASTINPNSNANNYSSSLNQNLTSNTSELACNENENDSSGEDDDDDEEMSSASQQQQRHNRPTEQHINVLSNHEREAIPLIDYILNVMKFIDAIFSNSSNGDNCREFVQHDGLKPLLKLLSLPNLPVDSPVSTTAQAIANVCKSVLNLAHETKVVDIALQQLSQILDNLKPLIAHFNFSNGSVLLCELITCPKLEDGFSIADYTPILHNMSAVHGYVILLVHLCRNASNEMRMMLLNRWGTDCSTGLQLLRSLVRLYISLVWESTILLSLCSDEPYVHNFEYEYDANVGQSSDSNADQPTEGSTEKTYSLSSKLKPEEQLRYIKSLLAASSRLGRALAELFGTLVKLSVGTPQTRQRRNNDFASSIANNKLPTNETKEIARVLSSILVNGFCHDDIASGPAPKLKLTFLICSVGFTGPMLFDDKRSSFHLMVSQFCEENGLKAFFEMFYWALSLDGSPNTFSFDRCRETCSILENYPSDSFDFPDGTGEFLDAWLQLLEKMVNPRAILDSPYVIASKTPDLPKSVTFEPVFYLIQLHQLAIQVIKRIWNRKPTSNYGVSMTETIMAILKHIVKSYNTLCERYKTRLNEILEAEKLLEQQKDSPKKTNEVNINTNHFNVLTDMGFGLQHVLEALRNTCSLEQATDYLLNHPVATAEDPANENSGCSSQTLNNDMDVDADLSQPTSLSATTAQDDTKAQPKHANINRFNTQLLPKEIFNKFCDEVLERIFTFMEYLPETINTGSELIAALYRRSNQQNKHEFVKHLVESITECINFIINTLKNKALKTQEELDEIISGSMATKLFIRLKISTILLDEVYSDIRKELCAAVSQEKPLKSLISLLFETESLLKEQTLVTNPRWLQCVIEFLDAIDNVMLILQRRENMNAICSDNWRWYDASTGKWNAYTDLNNILIKNAFNLGEKSVAITIGRQRYTINFNCMTQVSEASGSHRPVLPALKLMEAIVAITSTSSKTENILTRTIKSKDDRSGVVFKDETLSINTLMDFSCTKSDAPQTEESRDTFTKRKDDKPTEAVVPTESTASGVKKTKQKESGKNTVKKSATTPSKYTKKIVLHEELVGLSRKNTTEIIICLVNLLKPDAMLNFETKLSILKLCARLTKNYDNAIAFYNNGGIELLLNMNQQCAVMGYPTYAIIIIRHVLEVPSVLQDSFERLMKTRASQTIPIGQRDLIYLLTQVSSAVARHPETFINAAKQVLHIDSATSFTYDDTKLFIKSQIPTQPKLSPQSEETAENTVKDLLRAIIKPCQHYGEIYVNKNQMETSQQSTTMEQNLYPQPSTSRKTVDKQEPCCCSWHVPSTNHLHIKPMLPRATLVKILADSVRSYQSLVPRIIVDHVYSVNDSPLIEKPQSCLSFILDNFLPLVRPQQDSEVSMMSRVLISSLSDCYNQPNIQTKVVDEIHDAILRSLKIQNSIEKNVRLQVLIGLIPVMIESPMFTNKLQGQRNNMYRTLLRQGIMTDLTKLSQYKDLSNSNTLTTIYSTLRPMEILLRLTVAPGALSSRRLLFGTPPHSSYSGSRQLYPRLTSRMSSDGTITSENVLRDIIRNVLSDRRQAFEMILTAEDVIHHSDDTINLSMANAYDENIESERGSDSTLASSGTRSQITFDQLWDDLLQNERIRIVGHNNGTVSATIRRNPINSDSSQQLRGDQGRTPETGASGGSDNASTSSEIVAAVVNSNALLGEVSTSESESDSNVSTENERHDDDEDDDHEDEDVNDGGVEDHSETDADDESHQFIEVFDHIYNHESSETASNDADVDADDEASEVSGRSGEHVSVTNNAAPEISGASSEIQNRNDQVFSQATEQASEENDRVPMNSTNMFNEASSLAEMSSFRNSLPSTVPSTNWVTPRVLRVDSNYRTSIDITVANSSISNQERNQTNPSIYMHTLPNTSVTIGNYMQRRDSSRRLVFLDQQYCAPMASYTNPTEEGQLDLFNQDALHWWLEEAKHLDLESPTHACLHVAHLLIPHLINEYKEIHKTKKNDSGSVAGHFPSPTNRRSAIPVSIQSTNTSSSSTNLNSNTDLASRMRSTTAIQLPEFDLSRFRTLENYEALSLSDCFSPQQPPNEVTNAAQEDESSRGNRTTETISNNEENNDAPEHVEDENGEDNDELDDTFLTEELNSTFEVNEENRSAVDNQNNPESISNSINLTPENDHPEGIDDEIQIVNEPTNRDLNAVAPVNQEATAEESIDTSNTQANSSDLTTAVRPEASNTAMSADVRDALGDLVVPEGVDPSFLAALPSEMREEVINEHLRIQRIRQRAQHNTVQVMHDSLAEVNPEFLAALPPNIQTEVLMQQRIEQQRLAAQTANPDDPVDTAAFFQNLPESLRQTILTDMDESQIVSLPPDLAAEAQYLRRDWESRNNTNLDSTQSNTLRRFPSNLQNLTDESRWHTNSIWYDAHGMPQPQHHQHTTIIHHHQQQIHGKPIALVLMEDYNNLLDPDSLATLLLFLFIDDCKLNYTRFHRVMRNLCYHVPTRNWITNALISIIQKTNEKKGKDLEQWPVKPQWLTLRVDAAFGYKSNVFLINKVKSNDNDSSSGTYNIMINPQAAQMVIKNCLDMLFVLAKHFPHSFVPFKRENKKRDVPDAIPIESDSASNSSEVNTGNTPTLSDELPRPSNFECSTPLRQSANSADSKNYDLKLDDSPSTSKAAANRNPYKTIPNVLKNKPAKNLNYDTNSKDFWDVLLKIDLQTQQRVNNLQNFPLKSNSKWEWNDPDCDLRTLNDSPFSKLLEMLSYKVICRSPQLTDMLVKLLATLSTELPKEEDSDEGNNENMSYDMLDDIPDTNSTENEGVMTTNDGKPHPPNIPNRSKRKLYTKNFSQLQLIIEVLTLQCGTCDGLENISKLIINLSQTSRACNAIFVQYLTSAILGLAHEVRIAVQNLLDEILSYKSNSNDKLDKEKNSSLASYNKIVQEGVMQDRFTFETMVLSAPNNAKPSCELQLPSIRKLLSPSSVQLYFLKTLKIFIEVQELYDTKESVADNTTKKSSTLSQIICLDDLWNTLSACLVALEESRDEYAVLVLQPTVEAFFLIHASRKNKVNKPSSASPAPQSENQDDENSSNAFSTTSNLSTNSSEQFEQTDEKQPNHSVSDETAKSSQSEEDPLETQKKLDKQNFLMFAEKHRTVLNQILRQSQVHLSDGPFAVLVNHTRILDFDVKRKYFQTELERIDEGVRREENTVSVRRVTVFEDSFRVLYRLGPEDWKNRFYIVFEDEEGQDAGGLLREWYVIISREIFNPMYALFCVSPGDRVTYMINPSSHANPNHLSYFKFVGRVIAKAVHDNKLLECYFTRSFYKHILGKQVKYTDMESQDYEFYKGLDYLMKNNISTLGYELTFSTEIQEFGVTQVRDLIPNGRNIAVTEANKFDYVQLVCQLKMSGSIRQQLDAFLEGFYDIIPKHLISIFNEQELELLISGLPDIDIEDLRVNTEYHKYTAKSVQIQWFWRALRSFDQADRAKFLQFVTGTSKVPLQGFGSLEGMNGIQKFQIHRDDRSTDRLPCAHTCFNQLDLPMYKSYEKLRSCLLKAIHECSEGFGFA